MKEDQSSELFDFSEGVSKYLESIEETPYTESSFEEARNFLSKETCLFIMRNTTPKNKLYETD